MSNAVDVATYFLGLGDKCPPLSDVQSAWGAWESVHPAAQQDAAKLPAGCHLAFVPGAPGCLVNLDLPAGHSMSNAAFAIEEVKLLFPVGSQERAFLQANLDNAEGIQKLLTTRAYPPTCRTLPAGGQMYNLGDDIPGTAALPVTDYLGNPKFPTVASAIAFFSNIP